MTQMDVFVDGEKFTVEIPNNKMPVRNKKKNKKKNKNVESTGEVTSSIPGMIVEYKLKNGDKVKSGDVVLVVEAMKMMNNIEAPVDGTLKDINLDTGDLIVKGDLLFAVDPIKN